MLRFSFLPLLLLAVPSSSRADKPDDRSVEQLAEKVRKSVVVVTTPGRDDKRSGLGTGFVVGEGLIATNYHVIGEGRAILVETSDGKKHEAVAVHAFDRTLDLAILRVDVNGLPILAL